MSDLVILAKEWRTGKVKAAGILIGLLSYASMWLLDGAFEVGIVTIPDAWPLDEYAVQFLALLVLFFAPPVIIQTRFYRRMWTLGKGFLFGLWYGMGWVCALMADALLIMRVWPGGVFSLTTWLKHYGTYVLVIMVAAIAISQLVWCANRVFRGKPVVLDAPVCSKCGYSLRGNPSGICAECGSGGTTEPRQ